MFRYDEFDLGFVNSRNAQFRNQIQRRLEGALNEEEFRPIRLRNGLYLQLHAYMLRVAIPYGTLNSIQMRALADIADKYDKGYGHFRTRQNIQFNWVKLKDVADILDDLAKVEMHAIQTSGNCIRNVTSDHLAGVAYDEVQDPRAGDSLRQVIMEGVPWPKPTVLHAARKAANGGPAYDDRIIRARLAQAFGRLIRRADDRGVFVLLSAAMPSRLLTAFPPGTPGIERGTLDEAAIKVAELASAKTRLLMEAQLGHHAEP